MVDFFPFFVLNIPDGRRHFCYLYIVHLFVGLFVRVFLVFLFLGNKGLKKQHKGRNRLKYFSAMFEVKFPHQSIGGSCFTWLHVGC